MHGFSAERIERIPLTSKAHSADIKATRPVCSQVHLQALMYRIHVYPEPLAVLSNWIDEDILARSLLASFAITLRRGR